jgi:catechol 2,3-dioxygenase-like lactoylglutathione lyase family enzyme
MPKLFRVIVPVANLERGVRFYRQVLGLEGQAVSPGRHYFDCEGTILAVYDPRADGDPHDARPLPEPIYLAVDDLPEVLHRAQDAGASFSSEVVPDVGPLGEIAVRPWGERSFYASDPSGNPLCFVSRETVFTAK